MTPSLEIRTTPSEAAALQQLLADLAGLAALDPVLVAAEVRPLVESVRARRRVCSRSGCGLPFLRRRRTTRGREFCSTACRVAAFRARYRGR